MKQVISTDRAPKAAGPYSQAVVSNGLVFASGQLPLDPATGSIVSGGIAEQTGRVLENLSAVLAASGSSLNQVVKTTVYLKDLAHFAAMNDVFARYFPSNPPARAALEAARLPKDALIEIDAIATLREGR
jgi:2-iminobutanoate/2-iminopropanoate deaminase